LAFREFHKRRARDGAPVAVLDIGASKAACFIARISGGNIDAPEIDIIGAGHHGMALRVGRAPAVENVERSVRAAIDGAERMAGERIHKITVAVNGRYLRARRIGVDLEIAGGVITGEDIDVMLREGMTIATQEGFAALHALPIAFRVDGEDIFADPAGLTGGFLSAELLGVGVRQSLLDNIAALIERCGLKVDEFVAGPYAAAEATLIEDEKELGVVLIDIGANATGYAVYDNGVLIDIGGVALGGGHITKDIAQIFGALLADAERVKTLHGSALLGPGDEHRFIDFSQLGAAGERVRASRADLTDVIAPRLEEIFEMIAEKLPRDEAHRSGLRRAVITGGGSLLVGAREAAERVFSMKSRLGRPLSFSGAPEAATGPGFSVCAGVLAHIAQTNVRHGAKMGLVMMPQSRYADSARLAGGLEAWLRARF